MFRKIVPFVLSLFFLCCICVFAGQAPITEIVTSSTVENIDASVLQYIPTKTFDLKNFQVPIFNSYITGLTQKDENSNKLYLFSLDVDRYIQRSTVTISPTGFDVQPQKKFGIRITESYPALQLTQFTSPLAATTLSNDQYKAYFLNSKGLYAHRSAQIYPQISGGRDSAFSGGISADGRFSWTSIFNNTYGIQHLTKFKPDASPIMATIPFPIISADITGDLPGGVRLFVYREIKPPVNGLYPTRLLIQKFDSVSFQLIGKPYPFTKYKSTPYLTAEKFQTVAVDPQGFGVAYTKYSTSCGKELLYFRYLDSNFKPFGKSKLLLGCNDVSTASQGVQGLDILPVQLSF